MLLLKSPFQRYTVWYHLIIIPPLNISNDSLVGLFVLSKTVNLIGSIESCHLR